MRRSPALLAAALALTAWSPLPARAQVPAQAAPPPAQAAPPPAGVSAPAQAAAPAPPPVVAPPPGHAVGTPPPKDSSQPDPSLPAGTIELEVLDELERPAPGIPVELLVSYESVAEGPKHETLERTTNEQGKVRFDSLSRELRYSYSIIARRGAGTYGVAPFRLNENRGQRVRLHVFPTTEDPMKALVGMRGFVYLQPREDVFHVEVLFRVLNLSTTSWVPRTVVMQLPQGFQAFDSSKEGAAGFVEEPGRGARMDGTFAPGQHDVRFTFQVPRQGKASQRFELTLPPHVADLRVITEAAPGMTLDVEGFGPAEATRGPSGDRVLITRRVAGVGSGTFNDVRIDLGGLPVHGSARWIAVLVAALIALGGLVTAWLRRGDEARAGAGEGDLERARELLLEELVAVERAFAQGHVGPRTHEQARRQLLDALARLDPTAPAH